MGNDNTISASVTPEFRNTVERIHDERGDGSISETGRHLMREGAKKYEQETFAETLLKHIAVALAIVALVGYVWASQTGYNQPVYVGVVWMIPAVMALWLRELWPGIASRLGSNKPAATEA